jgi:hypothetical protein
MGSGIPLPPETDLVQIVFRAGSTIVFSGLDSEGKSVQIVRHGETSYFDASKKYKVTFDPLP